MIQLGAPSNTAKKLRKTKFYKKRQRRENPRTKINLETVTSLLQPVIGEFLTALISRKIITVKRPKARYSPYMKNVSLSLYFRLHRAKYEMLSSLLPLPSISTVDSWLTGLRCTPGINKEIFHLLKMKHGSKRSILKRLCILLIDEITLRKSLDYDMYSDMALGFETSSNMKMDITGAFDKQVADGTLSKKQAKIKELRGLAKCANVFMAKGIMEPWKQPLGYSLHSSSVPASDLKKELNNYVEECKKAGLIVLAVCTDQGSSYEKAFRELGVTTKNPFITLDSGQKLINFKDALHLGKSSRNLLLRHPLKIPGYSQNYTAKWKHITTCFELDKKRRVRAAHKVKRADIYNLKFQKLMKVAPAFRVLSATFSSSISCNVANNIMPSDALATAEYLSKLNEALDLFNSRNITDKNPQKRPYNDSKLEWLLGIRKFFEQLKILNSDLRQVHLDGWIQNTYALEHLFTKLKQDYNATFLCTRNLTSDSIENFFALIRFLQRYEQFYIFLLM